MAVQQEIKSQLAKLLATEDLIVEHKNCETASFNVHTRLLTLPMWDKATNIVYDLLVGHEVGHALFTPDEDPPAHVPFQFVNVVEDARIEKMMKRKYPGLAKTFFKGYQELNEEDFFSISDGDVANFNLADRANLYFKVGNFVDISFTQEEDIIIRMIEDCETFEDVVRVAEILHNYCKKKKEDKPEVPMPSQSDEGQVSPNSESEQQIEDTDEEGTEPPDQQSISNDSSPDILSDDIEVQTADALSDNIKDLIRDTLYENNYVEIPNLDFKSVVVDNIDIHEYCNTHFYRYHEFPETFDEPDKMFVEFKRSAQKEVNYLVKEFECRKSAAAYSRSSVARTGVLDCSRLHTYKYNEDLFKKVTVLPEGKNHGLIFVLDWSGSMSSVMTDTCKQLFNLIWFCKKVSIPFEVYAFSNEWNQHYYDENGNSIVPPITPHYVKKENLLSVDDRFSMLNILTSKTSGKELEKQMKNIWRLAHAFGRTYQARYSWPERLSLSGTPLNESLVALHTILPKFQKENKLQKVQCIILTDGEANQLSYHTEIKTGRFEPYIGNRRCDCEFTILRDRKLGTTYKFGWGYHEFTKTMLRNLKDKFPQVNFIGIRVLEGRNINNFIKLFYSSYNEVTKLQQDWKKTRSICIKESGYDAYFALSSSSLSQDSSFDVDDGATKAKIKSAFVKSLKVKKLNKKVLGEFISLVV